MPSAARYAPSSLTRSLIDDAAIFPPGLVPLETAVERHRALRRSPLAPYIGPFLLRASWWEKFAAIDTGADDIDVVLICRPDEDLLGIDAAVRGLTQQVGAHRSVRLRGLELPWAAGEAARITATLTADFRPNFAVAFEIDAAAPDVDLAAIGRYGTGSHLAALGKFRTGGVRPEDSPPAGMFAGVIVEAARQHVPVKFTAGLHHAVTGSHGPGGSLQFGVLNVIAAVRQAISRSSADAHDAALVASVSGTLLRTDATSLAADAVSLSDDDAAAIRRVFASFGCCGVTEPLAELAGLGVIPELPEGAQP
jgi:hypothetical protein